jgi:hypothetical protein
MKKSSLRTKSHGFAALHPKVLQLQTRRLVENRYRML